MAKISPESSGRDAEEEGENLSSQGIFPLSRGLLLALISGFMLSCVTLSVKYLKNIYPGQLAIYLFWALASFSLPQLIFNQQHVLGPPGYRLSLMIRGICSTTGSLSELFTFRYLPIGEAAVLTSSYPAFVTLGAKCFLNESFGLLQMVSLIGTIVGMILTTGVYQSVIENSRVYTRENIYGFIAAIVGVSAFTVMFLMTRKLKHIDHSVILFQAGCLGFIGSLAVTADRVSFILHCESPQRVLIILLGLFTALGIAAAILAMRYVEAGPVTTMRASSNIVSSFVWQVIVFDDTPDGIIIIGATLVGISILCITLSKRTNNDYICIKCLKCW